ncbi:MAG TPA: GAF domain-containing sensor histidine kinase [Solirubrobacteraceae bacterium]|nr:GAF domain-containing sensor histidine kinase [Solirubrobacteraceae bacterium]HUA71415.1 GAF domain-containing sensor histidine kinase [Solirubrobacteraceae bacterium]
MSSASEGEQIRRLLEVGRALVAEHDTQAVLDRILDAAREITGARYAALGVLDETRQELERFITIGIDAATHSAIGDLPRGRGVLGVLIRDPRPLRLGDVGQHPESYGFPLGHPEMQTFLGVPIIVRGEGWGNLYLTEKEGGEEFTEQDEEAAVILAQWAATAIDNARLYEGSEERRQQLERAVRSLEAARDIADAVSGASDLDRVLELIVKRGRALVDARTVLILLREGDQLVVAASAGHAGHARGRRVPIAGSTSGQVLEQGRPARISDASSQLMVGPADLGVPGAHSALLVPMLHRGSGLGVLAVFDHGPEAGAFSQEDEQLLRTFASSAAQAVALNRSVEADRLRSTIAAADAERSRWARELHDQTLQSLGGLRVALSSVLGKGDVDTKDTAIRQAIEDIDGEIANLRGIITDLRPSMLDDLGLVPAIEALLDRRRDGGLEIAGELTLADVASRNGGLDPELETTIYRLVQESLTNVVKHARAGHVRVSVAAIDGEVRIEVQDDGVGFDPAKRNAGFGLAGMRERVYLAGGTVELESSDGGTLVRARLPQRVEDAPTAAATGRAAS